MKATVVRPSELGVAELDRWRGIQRGNPTLRNPFLSPDFSLAIDRARPTARVAVLEDGGQIVGFFPHELRGRCIGKAIGSGISDCQGFIHTADLDWDAMQLVRECRLPVWEFDHLIAGQHPFSAYHFALHASPIMNLINGFPAYVAERQQMSKIIKDSAGSLRKLGREIGEPRVEFEMSDPATLELLMKWKSEQYQRTGATDRFARRWIVQVVTELLDTRTPECTGTLSVLYAADRPVAAHFGIRSEAVLSWMFPAYDVQLSRYSPGVGLLLQVAEIGATRGLHYIDLGRGREAYKGRLKSGDMTVAEGMVAPSRAVAVARRGYEALRHDAQLVRGKLGSITGVRRAVQAVRSRSLLRDRHR